MSLGSRLPFSRVITRSVIGTLAGCTVLAGVLAATVAADPADDALAKLNVRRLSAGTAIAQIVSKHVALLAESFLNHGDCEVFNEDAMPYSQLQHLFEGQQ